MERYVDDDDGYLSWVAANPDGFVLNIDRHATGSSLMLHRAACDTITGRPARGSHWTKDYAKFCGSRGELERFAEVEVGGQLQRCGRCM